MNIDILKRIAFIILQCTWGIGATLIGAIVFMIYADCPHDMYRCAVDTRWKRRGSGLGLGLFIFTPDDDSEYTRELRVHEYGHSIQSIILGPFMLIVGIVSVTWNMLPYFRRRRSILRIPYTSCFVERWASMLGEAVTGEKALHD
ncbi:MAG: hypothetical protein IJH41_01085 [Eubacterium sp.]|nr:hypothetical protein [Eubacterium sp.]